MRALYTAATGMAAQELNVQVISNNIANLRTTGYKKQRAQFQDLIYEHVKRVGAQASDQGTILPVGIDIRVVTAQGNPVQPTITIPQNSSGLTINQQGQVSVTTPGTTTPTVVGQIGLTRFINKAGLQSIGDNLFTDTPASGPPQDGIANADGFGDMQQRNLEQANVEVVSEISDLIAAQRAYEMNAKVVSAADQMMQATTGMFR